jgi:hypothetical protein
MLLYFGSRGIMPQSNACLCDVDHIDLEFFSKLEFVMSGPNPCAHEELTSFHG